ncbi:hypothetical protein HanRHA438_Chr06g0264311 [Helianthus annuus]|nr:hypothetical protein HanRHA438_Chr06g0264311 [Helianthus annuus]
MAFLIEVHITASITFKSDCWLGQIFKALLFPFFNFFPSKIVKSHLLIHFKLKPLWFAYSRLYFGSIAIKIKDKLVPYFGSICISDFFF